MEQLKSVLKRFGKTILFEPKYGAVYAYGVELYL